MSFSLHVACCSGKKSAVRKIIESVPNLVLETKDENGRTPLFVSAAHNQIECAGLLLKAGVHVDNSDKQGWTALHVAVYKGYHRCVRLLLLHNASCQQQDISGVTPLHLASIHDNPKSLFAMLKVIKPGGIDIQDNSKKSALHWSAAYSNIENLKNLLLNGANACIPDIDGKTPLHWAASSSKIQALDCVKTLIEKENSLINWQDYEGRSAVHLAVATGHEEVVHFLASKKCNVDVLDNAFCTPLHWAAKSGLHEKANILLKGRASNVSADGNGATPLHYAAFNDHAETVRVFLSQNSDCEKGDINNKTACIWASASQSDVVLKMMAENGVNLLHADKNGVTALHAAAIAGHVSTVQLLLQLNVPVELKDKYGMTSFLRACEYGRSKTAQMLINHDASIFMKDLYLRTALHWCAVGGHAFLCQVLLHKGVKCNTQDAFGMTPLHCACTKKGSLNCASILLESGANPDITDMNGNTPLHLAVLSENYSLVRLLCEYDADVNAMVRQKSWMTPLDLAVSRRNDKLYQLLKNYGALQYKDIENIAASKIQIWFRICKSRKEDTCEIIYEGSTKNECLDSNIAFLKQCQEVVDSCNIPDFNIENSFMFTMPPECHLLCNLERPDVVDEVLQSKHRKDKTHACIKETSFIKDSLSIQAELDVLSKANCDVSTYHSSLITKSERLIKHSEDFHTKLTREKAAFVIQRWWKKFLLKHRFKRMRKNIQSSFKTSSERIAAEKMWDLKLQAFLHKMTCN